MNKSYILVILLSFKVFALDSNNCDLLSDFPIDSMYGIPTQNFNELSNHYFGYDIDKLNDDAINKFRSEMLRCRNENDDFFSRYHKDYFFQYVDEAISVIKQNKNKYTYDEALKKYTREIELKSENQIIKVNENTATEADKKTLESLRDELKSTISQGHSSNELLDLYEKINKSLSDYIKNKQRDEILDEHIANEQRKIDDYNNEINQQRDQYKNNIDQFLDPDGPDKQFLLSTFRTYAGNALSGDMGLIARFIGSMNGDRTWRKVNDGWIYEQTITDEITLKKTNIKFLFRDYRNSEGFILLENAVIDNQYIPQQGLARLVSGIVYRWEKL